jgi:hypothetical protein
MQITGNPFDAFAKEALFAPEGYAVAVARGNGNQRIFVAPKERIEVPVFAGEQPS